MKNKGAYITIGEFLSTVILFIYMYICNAFKTQNPYLLHWFGIVIFFYGIYTWKSKTASKWFSPYTILLLFFIIFNYGAPIMWAFNIHVEGELGTTEMFSVSGYKPMQSHIIKTQWYVCLAMLTFHFGALLSAKRVDKNAITAIDKEKSIDYTTVKKAMRIAGALLLCILTPIAISSKAQEVAIAQTYGYKALYYGDYSTQGGYIQIMMYLFFPALVCFLIGNDYSKKSRLVAYSIFGVYAFLSFLSGDRGSWLYSLVILIWLHTHYVKTPIRKFLLIGALGVVGIYMLSVITAVRNTGLDQLSAEMFLEAFSAEESPIVGAFFEMGGSMNIITYFLRYGREIYPFENTYLVAILGAVSSRILRFLGLKQVFISNWFSQDYLGIDWGTGFSMLGEAYVNGGYYGGLVYMFMWGFIFGKLVQAAPKTDSTASPIRLFVAVSSLNAVVGFARNTCYLVIKELLYGTVLMLVLIYIFSATLKRISLKI